MIYIPLAEQEDVALVTVVALGIIAILRKTLTGIILFAVLIREVAIM